MGTSLCFMMEKKVGSNGHQETTHSLSPVLGIVVMFRTFPTEKAPEYSGVRKEAKIAKLAPYHPVCNIHTIKRKRRNENATKV